MPTITGTIKNSGNQPITGRILVTLDAPLIDASTNPDSVLVSDPFAYALTNGVVNLSLPESETKNITYKFEVQEAIQTETFYFENGTIYGGIRFQHTDNNWYTGQPPFNAANNIRLYRSVENNFVEYLEFHAKVPNTATVEFVNLLPTGITHDFLDTSIPRIVDYIFSNPLYLNALRQGIPQWLGVYSPTAFYSINQMVGYAGASWVYVNPVSKQGSTPSANNPDWQLSAAKGDPGGTGGVDIAYDAIGWDGNQSAPTMNAVRDIIEVIRTPAIDLNPYARKDTGNVFTGANTFPSPVGANEPATLGFADGRYGRLISVNIWAGTNTFNANSTFNARVDVPTVARGANDTRSASAAFVQDAIASGIFPAPACWVRRSAAQTLTIGSNNTITWDSFSTPLITGNMGVAGDYTIPVDGRYVFLLAPLTISMTGDVSAAGLRLRLRVYLTVNNVDVGDFFQEDTNSAAGTPIQKRNFGLRIESLTAGQVIRVVALPSVGGSGGNFTAASIVAGAVNNTLIIWRAG